MFSPSVQSLITDILSPQASRPPSTSPLATLRLGTVGFLRWRANFFVSLLLTLIGIPEDPVTGSAHTVLAPYWSALLKKVSFFARQVGAFFLRPFCESSHHLCRNQNEAAR